MLVLTNDSAGKRSVANPRRACSPPLAASTNERRAMKNSRTRAVTKLLGARQFVLVTPTDVVMQGQIADGFDGFLEVHALVMMRDALTKIIKEWESKYGGNKVGTRLSSKKAVSSKHEKSTARKHR